MHLYKILYSVSSLRFPFWGRRDVSSSSVQCSLISYMLIVTSSILPRLHPHLLQVLDDSHIGIHVAVDAVLHAGVFVALEGTGGHAAGDALLEADGVEFVDGWDGVLECK